MREYRQLTEEDRIEIYAMKQAGKEQNKIAAKLGVHPSNKIRLPPNWAYIPARSAGNCTVIPVCGAIVLNRPNKRLYIEGLLPVKRLR